MVDLEAAAIGGVVQGGSMAAVLLLYLDRRLVSIEAALVRMTSELAAALRARPPPPNATA
jgi:hypothetical protein